MLRRLALPSLRRPRRPRSIALAAGFLIVLAVGGYVGGRHAWAEYHARAGERALQNYRPQDAHNHFNRALIVWPASASIHLRAARAARQAGDLEAARGHLLAAQRADDPPSDEAILEWALLEAESGELAKVEDFLRAKLTPAFAERSAVAEALANGYLKALRLFDALNILEGWVAREPQNPAAFSLRARVWNQVRTFGRAAEDFETALRLDPDRDADRLGLGMALIEVSRYEEAIPHLERLRAADPLNPDIAVYAAFALDRVGREDEAVRILNDVLARDPDHVAALIGHARIDLETGREADAERYARRVLASTPNHRTAYHILHQALVSLGRVEDARVAKARLVELDDLLVRYYDLANRKIPQKPNDPNLFCQLGDVLLALGQTRQAEGWFLNAVRIAPKYAPAHRSLAAYYAKAGDEDKAAEHRQLAESAPP